ncbi:MAG: V0D/AC39 family V-type ATPase subunit [bacterium]
MVSFKEDVNFATVVGKVRALESRLFSIGEWERLLSARSFSDFLRLLIDTPYGRFIVPGDPFESFQIKLIEGFFTELEALDSLCPEDLFLFYFRYKVDLGNIKRILYGLLSNKDVSLYQGGTLSIEFLEEVKRKKDINTLRGLPYPWDIIKDIDLEPVFWTYYLEQSYFNGLLELSKNYSYELLYNLLTREIDLENFKMALRIKISSYPERYRDFFYSGGSIEIDLFKKLLDAPLENWHESNLVELLGLREYINNPMGLEKVTDERLIEVLSISKYTAFGYEPVLNYLFRKEIENKNILFLFSGFLYGLPANTLRGGIRGL